MSDQAPPLEQDAGDPGDRGDRGDVATYRCPSCGATTAYAPGTTQLKCPSCGAAQQIEAPSGQVHEHDYTAWLATGPRPVAEVALQQFRCASCGATTDSAQLAGACAFCSGALVAVTIPDGLIEPEGVLPFTLDRSAATASFGTWLTSRWFAPNALKRLAAQQRGLQGVYVPHWTYDASTATDYRGQRGEHRTRWRTVTDSNGNSHQEVETYTEWHSASGHVGRRFDDVLVPASSTVVPERLADLGPWEPSSAVAYRPDYLAGYAAVRYDLDPDRGLEAAKTAMAAVIERDCRADIGGDEQRVTSMQTSWSELMFKLLLLPVWIAAYTFRGRTYQVIVNAQTGEVLGERPYSKVKIALAVLAVLLLVALIVGWILLARNNGT